MKPFKTGLLNAAAIIVLSGSLLLASCGEQPTKEATNSPDQAPLNFRNPDSLSDTAAAARLLKTCHFISVKQIQLYTDTYQRWQREFVGKKSPAATNLGNIESFNKSIVQVILSEKACIGLRVLYGMDEKLQIHAILVGVDSNYNNLYILRKQAKCEDLIGMNGILQPAQGFAYMPPQSQGDPEEKGGAEMGQMP